jgi:hypothetical protein
MIKKFECSRCRRVVDAIDGGDGDMCSACWCAEAENEVRGWDASNPILCEHANEVPAQCSCAPDCYCKSHTCRPVVNSLGVQIGTMGPPLGKGQP